MLNKEAKTKALREGLKKYLGNLSGKNVRVNKKARDNAKEKGLRFAKDFEERGYPRLGKAKREYTLELFNQHNEVIRPLARSRDKARAGTALAVGAVGGGALLAKKKSKGKEKTAIIGPVADLGNVGIPSAIGYAAGSRSKIYSKEQAEEQAKAKWSDNLLAALLVPGYTGYHHGKKSKARKYLAASKQEKTASVALISPVTLIAMREEFQEVYEKEAERVSVKVAKARLSEIIRERI